MQQTDDFGLNLEVSKKSIDKHPYIVKNIPIYYFKTKYNLIRLILMDTECECELSELGIETHFSQFCPIFLYHI